MVVEGRLGIVTRWTSEVNRGPLFPQSPSQRPRGAVINTRWVSRTILCPDDRWGYNEIQRVHKFRPYKGIPDHDETQTSGKHFL